MKKLTVILLSLTVLFACVATLFVSAAEEYAYLDLRPTANSTEQNDQYSVTGATVEVASNGVATVTLTEATATVVITYKNSGAIYEEAYADVTAAKYVMFYYDLSSPVMGLEIHAHYDRGDKDDADLYVSGMKDNPGYFELSGDNYGVWDIFTYLDERSDRGYMPEDNIIKFSDITYRITGAAGDIFTIYYFELGGDFDEDFGTVVPGEDQPIDLSEPSEPAEPSEPDESEPAASEPTASEPAASEPAASEPETPPTGDAGIIALAVISTIALAGAVVIKRR